MNTLGLSTLACLSVVFAVPEAQEPRPPASRELRYRWEAGKKLRYDLQGSMSGSLRIGVGDVTTEVPLDYDVSYGLELLCERVDARRTHRATLSFVWIRIEERQGGQHATFDTRDPAAIQDHPLEPLYRELLRLTEQPLAFQVGPRGEPSFEVSARERLATIGSPLDPTQLETDLARIFPDLPVEAVSEGARWSGSRNVEMPTLGSLALDAESVLKRLDDKGARIETRFVPVVERDVAEAVAAGLPPLKLKKASGWQELEGGLLRESVAELEVALDLVEDDLRLRGDLVLRSHVVRR